MRKDAAINRQRLQQTINKNYNFKIRDLRFIPIGECSYCYLINNKSVAKVHINKRNPNLDCVLKIVLQLHDLGINNISYPIKTKNEKYKVRLGSKYTIAVFNYIDGRDFEELSYSKIVVEKIAKLLANVHKCTNKLELGRVPKEKFDIPFKKDLLKSIKDLENNKNIDNKYKKELRKLVLESKDIILQRLRELEIIRKKVVKIKKKFVLCHTDPIGSNILKNSKENIYLIDWDDIKLAPVEHDIWFYLGKKYGKYFIKSYKMVIDLRLNKKIISFYVYRRYLEDLADWVKSILYLNDDNEQNKSDLEGVEEYCVPCLKNIEQDINQRLSLIQ